MKATSLILLAGLVLAVCLPAGLLEAGKIPPGKKVEIKPDETAKIVEAMKLLYARGQYGDAVRCAYVGIWNDMKNPEVLRYLVMSLRQPGEREDAAAFCHILQMVLEDPKFKADPATPDRKRWCQMKLKTLDVRWVADQKKHRAATAERKFTSPEEVDDLWMTEVRADPVGLHGLYAWKLVGGRKDVAKDWIHNTQGRMHRSSAKYMDDVHGRKGVLFTIPAKKSKRVARLIVDNPGTGKFLRIGTRAYGFSFELNVTAGEKQLLSKTIGKDNWEDLKVPLDADAAKEKQIVLELVIPENQRWSEGAFLDYVEFFQD